MLVITTLFREGGVKGVSLICLCEVTSEKIHFTAKYFDPVGVIFRLVLETFLEVHRSYMEGKYHYLQFFS
jgi:hypothetical protein